MPVSPPRPKGPPLNALRAFEASARRRSFSIAADELNVTPGAVAQHVKALEAWAGAPLFTRHARGVELTALGESVLPSFVEVFDQLGEAVHKLRAHAMPNQVRIVALPSVAQLWLSPRLPAIRAAISGTTISITAQEAPPNLNRDQFDISIFLETLPEGDDGFDLGADKIFPVCAPTVASRLREPGDLRSEECFRDASWAKDWDVWMAVASPKTAIIGTGSVFSLYSLAIDEAVNGAGVVIGHDPLVRHHLENGTLVEPFNFRVELEQRLVLRRAHRRASRPEVDQVIDLLCG